MGRADTGSHAQELYPVHHHLRRLRHVETVVKPWLVTNVRHALNDQRLLLGVVEDDIDENTKWDLLQIVEDALGGFWDKSQSKWESRRDAVLELIGKATPGAFRPALQIDPSAKLIIEALSGRWTYESKRRERSRFGTTSLTLFPCWYRAFTGSE
jgi:hypothetical protein